MCEKLSINERVLKAREKFRPFIPPIEVVICEVGHESHDPFPDGNSHNTLITHYWRRCTEGHCSCGEPFWPTVAQFVRRPGLIVLSLRIPADEDDFEEVCGEKHPGYEWHDFPVIYMKLDGRQCVEITTEKPDGLVIEDNDWQVEKDFRARMEMEPKD